MKCGRNLLGLRLRGTPNGNAVEKTEEMEVT